MPTISFKVSGSELSNYITDIQRKQDKLSQDAIKAAISQTDKGREQLKIINEQIAAMDRKSKIESQAMRQIATNRKTSLSEETYFEVEKRRKAIEANPKLSGAQKDSQIDELDIFMKERDQEIKNQYKEQLHAIREQEREQKIGNSFAKENVDAIRDSANRNIRAIQAGDLKLVDVISKANTEEEKLVARLTKEGLTPRTGSNASQNIVGSVLAVDNINKLINTASQFSSTQNGFDLIKPGANLAGRVIGSVIGAIIGGVASGGTAAFAGAAAGASIGGGFGDTIGEFEQRRALGKEDFYKARNRFNSITGNDPTIGYNTEASGLASTDYLKMQSDYARRRGYSSGSAETTRDAFYAEKGYGIDQGSSALLIELQRSSRESNRDLAGLISGIVEKGQGNIFKNGDNTFLNEFVGKFATVQKEFLKSQTYVASGTTMDVLSRFNKVGGEFDLRDSRAMGNINAVQNSLSNPAADNIKAMAFRVLSGNNPNQGIFDIREQMQKGLSSPGYLKGMMGMIDQIGGDDQMKMSNLSGMFPGLSLSAVRRLYQNRDALKNGSISMQELQAKNPLDFQGKSESNTTTLEKNIAEINNGILKDRYETLEAMADAFRSAIENTMTGAVITLNDGAGTIRFSSRSAIRENATYKANSKKINAPSIINQGPNGIFFK